MSTSTTPSRPHPWWVGTVAGMASYLDAAAIISFSLALVIYQNAIGLSGGQIGIASGLLTFGIAVGAVAGGGLGDRFGRRPVFTVTMALIVVGAVVLVFTPGFAAIAIAAVMVGLGVGADLPVSLATIAEAANDANRGKLIGLSQILWFVGILVAASLGAAFGNAGRLGGQVLFGHLAVVALLVLIARLAIPESKVWREAQGSGTSASSWLQLLGQLFKAPYLGKFAALPVFYSLINLSANTLGQFGSYLLVNEAGTSASAASALSIIFIPVSILGTLWFMAIADGKHRFGYFVFGAVLTVVGNLIPVFVGYSVVVYVISNLIALFGAVFAGESIMKLWTQESFPTLLRGTAQGAVIAVARFIAAMLASVTPIVVAAGVPVLYGLLSGLCAVGVITAGVVFGRHRGQVRLITAPAAN